MMYHGHLTHPDIWTMWFSLFVCIGVCLEWLIRFIIWSWDYWYCGLVAEWKFTAYRVFYDGWHHVAHIGPMQFEIYTWGTIFIDKKGDPSQ